MRKGKLSDEQRLEIIKLYTEGVGTTSLGKQFGVHENSIMKLLKVNGVPMRAKVQKIFAEDEAKIVEMYKGGMSAQKIADQYHVNQVSILKHLEKNNIERRSAEECHRIYEIHENFFDVIDTQEKAYVLGFIYADGSNVKEANAVRITLSRIDRDILEKIAPLIYIDNPLEHVRDHTRSKPYLGKTREESYITFHSKYMCNKLEELGCTPRKSLTLKFPEWLVDPELQRHFIRGYYDGDGGVYLPYEKGRGASSKMISTFEFCNSVSQIIFDQIEIKFGEPYMCQEDKNIYTINIAGSKQVKRFLDWLYKGCSIYLNRKYNLYLELIQKNEATDDLAKAGTRGYPKKYIDY